VCAAPDCLPRTFPDHGFQCEESILQRERAPYRWIIDPLDGTTNFVHGLPWFAISIALSHRGVLVVGVIFDPMRQELFVATKGGGAFVNGHRLSVSRTRHLADSLLATGFSPRSLEHPKPYLTWFRAFQSRCHAVRRMGSSALTLAHVAAGRLDGFYERDLWPWDMAAGALLIREAGGRVSNFQGRPPILSRGRLVASNGRIHQQMLRLLHT